MKKVSYATVTKTVLDTISKHRITLEQIDFVISLGEGGLFPAALTAVELKKIVYCYGIKFDNSDMKGKSLLVVTDFFHDDETALEVKQFLLDIGAIGVEFMSVYHMQGNLANPLYSKKINKQVSFPWS